MNIKVSSFILASLLILPNLAIAKTENSEYRPNTKVEFIYDQELEEPYSTAWYAKLEKRSGTKRTVYIETVGKFVQKGFITFDCKSLQTDVQLSLYNWADYGDNSQLEHINVYTKDLKSWENNSFEPLWGETPPYALYKKLRVKYCKK